MHARLPFFQGMPLGPYMVAFSYGAVVFFDAADRAVCERFMTIARRLATEPLPLEKAYNEGVFVCVVGGHGHGDDCYLFVKAPFEFPLPCLESLFH